MKLIFKKAWPAFLVFLLLSGTSSAASYVVSGAVCDPSANGTYDEDGMDDGAPKYTKGSWTLERDLGGMDNGWVILNGVTPVYRSYANPSPLVPLNNHNWYCLVGSGGSEFDLEIVLAEDIPSLNEWGGILMMVVLSGIGIAVIRKINFPHTGAGV